MPCAIVGARATLGSLRITMQLLGKTQCREIRVMRGDGFGAGGGVLIPGCHFLVPEFREDASPVLPGYSPSTGGPAGIPLASAGVHSG